MQCPFCEPQVKDLPIVERNEHCLAIDVADEILAGSRIIVPRQHRTTPFELTEAEITATFELLRAAKSEIDSALSPDGYNIGWNWRGNRRAGGIPCTPSCRPTIPRRAPRRQGDSFLVEAGEQSAPRQIVYCSQIASRTELTHASSRRGAPTHTSKTISPAATPDPHKHNTQLHYVHTRPASRASSTWQYVQWGFVAVPDAFKAAPTVLLAGRFPSTPGMSRRRGGRCSRTGAWRAR